MAAKPVRDAPDPPPQVRAFPAGKLGPFLRAMADPDAHGVLSEEQQRRISDIEDRLAAVRRNRP